MKYIKGVCLFTLAMFLFSFIGIFSRFSGKDPFSVSFYRAFFSMFIFLGIYLGSNSQKGIMGKIKNLRIPKELAGIIFPYGLSIGITILTFICAYLYTTMANTILLHYLMPLFVFLGSFCITGERVHQRSVIGFILGLLGVALISGFDILKGAGGRVLLGDLLAFISGVSYAGIILWTRKARLNNIDIIYFVFWGWAIAAAFCLPFIILFGEFCLSIRAFFCIISLSVFSTVLPFITSNIAMKYLSAQASSVIAYSEAAFVIVWGILFYKEALTWATLLGAGFIFFSILVIAQKNFNILTE